MKVTNMTPEEKLQNCYAQIKERLPYRPEIALVLGSGLGDFVASSYFQADAVIPYEEIQGFPVSTVPGHAGRFVLGHVGERRVICMQGRVHYYEGYDMQDVVLPIRLMHLCGANMLFLTNAAGGVNESFHVGDFCMLEDHISSFVPSPLIGANLDELGPRFPDMSEVYSKRLQEIIMSSARELDIVLQKGVYVQLTGPNYETPAEIRMVRALGADAVGMSTVCEAMTAVHAGMEVCGISLITNMAAGICAQKLSHDEVKTAASAAGQNFCRLVAHALSKF